MKVNTKHVVNYFQKWPRIVLKYIYIYIYIYTYKSKVFPLQARCGPEGG